MKRKGVLWGALIIFCLAYSYMVAAHKWFPFNQLYSVKEYLEFRYGWFAQVEPVPDLGTAEVLDTELIHLLIKKVYISSDLKYGGGLAVAGDHLYVASNKGLLFHFNLKTYTPGEDTLLKVPINYDELILSGHTVKNDFRQIWFRVHAIHAEKTSEGVHTLYASHHRFEEFGNCVSHNISKTEIHISSENGSVSQPGGWETLFTAEPCIELEPEFYQGRPFNGNISGGRIVPYNDQMLLTSVGDYDNNGLHGTRAYAMDTELPYGKLILVNKQTGDWEPYTIGHRNAAGIYIDNERQIWSTENGPFGGDELNLIERGNNYGWPEASYGHWYIPSEPVGDYALHEGYTKPVFSWLPAIAPSNLIRVEHERFGFWKGDLLVATMKNQSLHRLRLGDNNRVVYDEQIRIDHRIRDIEVLPDGRIVLLTDDGFLIFLDDGGFVIESLDASVAYKLAALNRFEGFIGENSEVEPEVADLTGADLFELNCSACHSMAPLDGIGPHLNGLMNREIGNVEDFNYSKVLEEETQVWTEERLRSFLLNPEAAFPGNRMVKAELTEDEVNRIIEYIADY
jgi:cytochrome c2